MGEVLLALLRVAHGLTAAIWLGLALVGAWDPALLRAARARGGWSARAVAQTSLWTLVITGAALMLDRLADPSGVSGTYVALLGVKLAAVAGNEVGPGCRPTRSASATPFGSRRDRTTTGARSASQSM
jgi:xanthine/uracil permease